MLGEGNVVQGIEAIGARITEIEDRIAAFATGSPAAPGSMSSAPAASAGSDASLAFQGQLQAATTQLAALTGQDPAALAGGGLGSALSGADALGGVGGVGGLGGLSDLAGLGGANGLGGLGTGSIDALTMVQRLGLDRSALAQSRIPSVAALGAASSTTLGAASSTPAVSAARNANGVPSDLAVYGNGKVPKAALTELSSAPGHRLWAPAAGAFERMRAAAAADGVSFGITDSYRPLDVQQQLARTKGLYKDGGLAAVPGTSQHGWGTAVDLKLDSEALSWMRANAGKFGFVADTPRESWHWVYQG